MLSVKSDIAATRAHTNPPTSKKVTHRDLLCRRQVISMGLVPTLLNHQENLLSQLLG